MSSSRGSISSMSSSGAIWDKSSRRGSLIFVSSGAVASFFSIALLVIATASDHWMDIVVDREAVVANLPQVIDTNQVRYYTRTSGLFRSCFPDFAQPTAGVYLSLMGEWCTSNPAWTPPSISFSSNSTTSFSSPLSYSHLQLQWATPLLLLVSVTTLSLSFLVFVSLCWSRSSTRLVVTAVFQLLGSAVAAAAMASWHAARFLHNIEIHADGLAWPEWLRQATQTSLGWSYFVAWAGIALSLIASLSSASAALVWRKRRKICHDDDDRTELSRNCGSPCHSTSINHNMAPCPAQTPRHSMLSCHSRPYSHGTCHSRPRSHGTCHSRPCSHGTCHSRPCSHGTCHIQPSSQGTAICHHKLMPSDEMRLGCNHSPVSIDGHSFLSRSYSNLDRARIPHRTNDTSVRQNCGRIYESSGNLNSERSVSETSSSRLNCGRIYTQDCECSQNLSCERSTSETSSSRQKSINWQTGNPADQINEMNVQLTSRGSENHQTLIEDSKRFVEKGSEIMSYEAGEAVDGQVGEEYDIRTDESFAEDERNYDVRIDETFSKKSDQLGSQSKQLNEDWDTPRVSVEHYDKKTEQHNKIPHSKEWDTSRIERYNKIPNSEDLDTSRMERYNKIPHSEYWDTYRIDRYNKIPHSKEWDTSRIERYNKIPDREYLDTSRIERYNKMPHSEDWDTSRTEVYNKIPHSEDWDTSRIERYNKKMLHILKNTMHLSDKYIREMLEF